MQKIRFDGYEMIVYKSCIDLKEIFAFREDHSEREFSEISRCYAKYSSMSFPLKDPLFDSIIIVREIFVKFGKLIQGVPF